MAANQALHRPDDPGPLRGGGGYPPDGDSAEARTGGIGAHRYELSPDTIATFDRIWDETIAVELGYPATPT